jgi:predicted Zn-dependent protease
MCKPNLTRVVTVYLFLFSLAISDALYAATEALATPQPNTELARSKQSEILYTLLVAEFATRNQEPGRGLTNYLKAARLSRDPEIAEIATHLAIELEMPIPALEAAALWAGLAPQNFQAQLVAMTLFVSQSPEKASQYLKQALLVSPEEFVEHVIEIQGHLSETSTLRLHQLLLQLSKEQPNNPYAQLSAAESAAALENIPEVKQLVEKTLRLSPGLTPAIQLKARLLAYENKNSIKALQFLKEKVEAFKHNLALRLFYAGALIDAKALETAKVHLALIKQDKTIGGQALLLLSEIAFKQKKFNESIGFLQQATDYKEYKEIAYYLLGQVEEHLGNTQKAIQWYKDVESGHYQVPAALRAVALLKSEIELLVERNQLDEALKLAEETTKYLAGPLALAPNNPYFIDSMGWLLYRTGEIQNALPYLLKAHELNQEDTQIAAHLGEALWHLNEKEAAKKVLDTAISKKSHDPYILDTLKRLNIERSK